MTSRSRAYLLSLFRCRLIIIILNPNPSPSLSTLSSYNNQWSLHVNVHNKVCDLLISIFLFKTAVTQSRWYGLELNILKDCCSKWTMELGGWGNGTWLCYLVQTHLKHIPKSLLLVQILSTWSNTSTSCNVNDYWESFLSFTLLFHQW